MGTVAVSPLTDLGTPERPAEGLVAAMGVWRASEFAELGHADFAYTPREIAATYADQSRQQRAFWVAERAGRCVGLAALEIPISDNHHLVALDVRVAPDEDVAGVLDALWRPVCERALTENRDTVIVWEYSRLPGELAPRTGSGTVARSAVSDWLGAHGFELEQAEIASVLTLPSEVSAPGELGGEAEAYELVQWVGATPEGLRSLMADLQARMSTDVPLGDVALEPEAWDAERTRAEDVAIARMGRTAYWSAALHRSTGIAAAFTCLVSPNEEPHLAFQEGTLVRADHRGHGLGMWVKAANLRLLATERPEVERVYTFNADENRHMLAINRRLGFQPASALGCWQRRGMSS